MYTFIDTLMSIIFSNLWLLHLSILGLAMVKAIHFSVNKSNSWKLYQWVHFDAVELRHSRSTKGLSSKKMQNKMTRIMCVLIIVDIIFSVLKMLIVSNYN